MVANILKIENLGGIPSSFLMQGFRIMRKNLVYFAPVVFLILSSIFLIGDPDYADAALAKDQSVTFFSQGQSTYNPQDQARSRQQAVQDFMGQALIQAIGKFLNPSQMGTQFPEHPKEDPKPTVQICRLLPGLFRNTDRRHLQGNRAGHHCNGSSEEGHGGPGVPRRKHGIRGS